MNWHHDNQSTTLAHAQATVAQPAPSDAPARPRRGWPEGDHKISIGPARELIERRRRAAQIGGAAFKKSALERVLNQTGCVGMRFYYGMNDDGTPCLVVVGLDESGEEQLDGELLEMGFPCPPFCPKGPSLGRARR